LSITSKELLKRSRNCKATILNTIACIGCQNIIKFKKIQNSNTKISAASPSDIQNKTTIENTKPWDENVDSIDEDLFNSGTI